MVQKIFNELVVCMMALAMLAPCVVFMHAVEATKTVAGSSKTFMAHTATPVYAKQTGESRASASVYTIVNGKVVTDIFEEKSSSDGSAVSVSIENSTNEVSHTQGKEPESPILVVTKPDTQNDAAVISRLKELITYLQQLLSLLHGY